MAETEPVETTHGTAGDLWTAFYRLRRQMTGSQIGANLAGAVTVTSYFVFFHATPMVGSAARTFGLLAVMFPLLVLIAVFYSRSWEKELIGYVDAVKAGRPVSDRLRTVARRKIIDQPFVSAALTGLNWLLAAAVMVSDQLLKAEPGQSAADLFWVSSSVFIGVVISGCVTVAIVFFATERLCRRIRPFFFPRGGLKEVPGALRLRLRDRMLVIFILTSILPVTLMAVLSFSKTRVMLMQPGTDVVAGLLALTAFVLLVTVVLAVVLSRFFAGGILTPIRRMEIAMQKVATGDFETMLPVSSNDELGSLAEHFNRMTEGLKERKRMKQSLDLAKEVQQSLLPLSDPEVGGLDIAGRIIYCEETGGDYYDYLGEKILGRDRCGIVIGDVCGHGLPSALMMATVRAAVRQRAALPGSIGQMITDVNRQFCPDVEETGGFVTLFFMLIDIAERRLHWVRAGHDPVLFYDPGRDRFEELSGNGIAIGIRDDWRYVSHTRGALSDGQIILLGTDGIWETRNPAGELFGKAPVRDIIRQHHRAGAGTICAAVLSELARFRQRPMPEDDVTLVVVKISMSPAQDAKRVEMSRAR